MISFLFGYRIVILGFSSLIIVFVGNLLALFSVLLTFNLDDFLILSNFDFIDFFDTVEFESFYCLI